MEAKSWREGMTEYYYHGSPLRLSELKEARPGEGIYLTPSRALAGMFGAMRNIKDLNKGIGSIWEYDLYKDYDETGNDTPRAFNALSNIRGMKELKGDADVYIHKVPLTSDQLKLIRQLGKSPVSHKVLFSGPELPVESVEKVNIPYTAKYGEEVEKLFGPAINTNDKYTIHGAVLGCLGDNASKFKYHVTEDLPGDPWKAVIATKPMSLDSLRKFHQAYNVDVDNAGVPYYFLTRNERTGSKGVWYSDSRYPMPINTKEEKQLARLAGLTKGLAPDQLDFKFDESKTKEAALDPAVKNLVDEIKTINTYDDPARTQSIREILKRRGTNCWGISRIALNRLRKAGLDPETVFIYEDGVPMKPTHQFTTFRDGDKYRVHDYWFNPNREQVSKPYKTREEAIDDRVNEWRTAENHLTPVDVYTGTRLPGTGRTHEEYMGEMTLLNDLLKRYPEMKKESRVHRLVKVAHRVRYERALQKLAFNRYLVKYSGLGPFGNEYGVNAEPDYHGNSLNSVAFTMRNYIGGDPEEIEHARKGRARHSVTFSTLDEDSFKQLKPEQQAMWVKYNPRWDNKEAPDMPYYVRSVAYTANPDTKGQEAYYAILSHIAGISPREGTSPPEYIRAQKLDPATGKFKNYYYRNTHKLSDGVFTPLKTRQFGTMEPGKFYNNAMDWLATRCAPTDRNSTCHKITSGLYATMPHLQPGVFSFGGWKGGTAVSENPPLYIRMMAPFTYPIQTPNLGRMPFVGNVPDFHGHRILQWDDGKPFKMPEEAPVTSTSRKN